MHAYAMRLHNGGVAIDVNDESREGIALTMNESERVVVVSFKIERLSQFISFGNAACPEGIVNVTRCERKDANGNGTNLVMSKTEKTTIEGTNLDDVALTRRVAHVLDGTRENPGMETKQRLFFAFMQRENDHETSDVLLASEDVRWR